MNFTRSRQTLTLAITGLALVVAQDARSVITIDSSNIFAHQVADAGDDATNLSYNSTSNFLAVAIYGVADANGVSQTSDTPVVTYGGVPMMQAQVGRKSNDEWTAIYYLANPVTGSNNLFIDFTPDLISHTADPTGFFGVVAFSLLGVDIANPVAGAVGVSTGGDITILSETPGEIGADDFLLVSTASDNVESSTIFYDTSSGDGEVSVLSGTHGTTKSYGVFYDSLVASDLTGANSDEVFLDRKQGHSKGTTAVVFNQIPEPASLALMGLGGLLMLSRRREA